MSLNFNPQNINAQCNKNQYSQLLNNYADSYGNSTNAIFEGNGTDYFQKNTGEFDYSLDDGKISLKDKAKNFAKGLISPITSMFKSPKNFLIGTAAIAGGAALVVATGGAIAPVLVAGGVVGGAVQFGKSAYQAANAETDAEAEAAWQGMGAGTTAVAGSVVGAKSALKGAGVSTEGLNPLTATVECFKQAPKSVSNSVKAFISGEAFANIKNLFSAKETAKTDGDEAGAQKTETDVETPDVREKSATETSEPKAEAETTEVKPELKTEPKAEPKTEARAETADPKPEAGTDAGVETPESKAKAAADASEAKTEPKTEPKTEAEVETADVKVETPEQKRIKEWEAGQKAMAEYEAQTESARTRFNEEFKDKTSFEMASHQKEYKGAEYSGFRRAMADKRASEIIKDTDTPLQIEQNLTTEEINAVGNYQDSSTGSYKSSDYYEGSEIAKIFEKVTPVDKEGVVYRTVDSEDIFGNTYFTDNDFTIGNIIENKGVISTSQQKSYVFNCYQLNPYEGQYVMRIKVPKGAKAIQAGCGEVMLEPKSMKVTGFNPITKVADVEYTV